MRLRFGVDYTVAGPDLLLHRIGWSVQVLSRMAAGRDEALIALWKDEQWSGPSWTEGGGFGRLACCADEAGQRLQPPKGPT
ncbi:winged helix-turn-helix domain-containing protein [Streptomyces sp. PSKA30]|uniref:helix-turn-helix domain-containing protein n=1 Tax=Streptomyces sp. PSKA30 TaxID=2874597 RepID=UPI0027E0392D|nr:winged helix-turn-helix domain-containing protein [Streptomyces sp. PSKA30]